MKLTSVCCGVAMALVSSDVVAFPCENLPQVWNNAFKVGLLLKRDVIGMDLYRDEFGYVLSFSCRNGNVVEVEVYESSDVSKPFTKQAAGCRPILLDVKKESALSGKTCEPRFSYKGRVLIYLGGVTTVSTPPKVSGVGIDEKY